MCPQLPLQVWMDLRDVLDRHQVFSDILPNTAWFSQP